MGISGVSLRLSADGPPRVVRRLSAMAARARDPWPGALGATLAAYATIARGHFDTESSGVGAWAPLAPSTQRERARLGYGAAHPILRRTGRLMRAYAGESGEFSARASGRTLTIRVTVPYARYHRTARDPAALTPDERRALLAPLRSYVAAPDAGALPARGVVAGVVAGVVNP